MLVDDKNRIAINQFQYEIKGNDQKLQMLCKVNEN
jgi:hypothetical protein